MAEEKKVVAEKIEKANTENVPKKKKTFWEKFMNFLMMGGFIVILIGVVAIVVVVELLMKKYGW